jgi:hypothetical protein
MQTLNKLDMKCCVHVQFVIELENEPCNPSLTVVVYLALVGSPILYQFNAYICMHTQSKFEII